MRNEDEIRRLLRTGMDDDQSSSRPLVAASRARRQVGQRDTLIFALVKIWSVLARLLAPLFAVVAEKQVQAVHQQPDRKADAASEASNEE